MTDPYENKHVTSNYYLYGIVISKYRTPYKFVLAVISVKTTLQGVSLEIIKSNYETVEYGQEFYPILKFHDCKYHFLDEFYR